VVSQVVPVYRLPRKKRGPWRPIKVHEATYGKIMLIKGTLEQTNRRPVTMGDTVDAIFQAACEELAARTGKKLPPELYLEDVPRF